MRREPVVVAALLVVACLAASPSASAQSRKKPFSGCEKGAHLAKVTITVEPNESGGGCHVSEVIPASVCVAPNGAIRWQVDVEHDPEAECEVLGSEGEPALKITDPDPRLLDDPDAKERPLILENCRFKDVHSQGPNIVFCDIIENAPEGFYKYGLTGKIAGVDPGIEVRGPRAP
jgi:hypothetical protein